MNKFEQVNRVAAKVRQAYGKRYNVKRAQLSEVVKLTAELSELRADRRRTFSEGSDAWQRQNEIESRLAQIEGQQQPTIEQLFKGVMR